MAKKEVDDILHKYKKKLSKALDEDPFGDGVPVPTRDYSTFKRELLEEETSNYERWAARAATILAVAPPGKDRAKLEESIKTAHLTITPEAASSFGALVGIAIILLGIFIGAISFIFGELWLFVPLVLVVAGAAVIKPLSNMPIYIADKWRLEASNQMVLCILYVVMYMRHTSNLEHAIKFASSHIGDPLSRDLKKILWDVETEYYFSIKESLDNYLEQWRGHNLEFIESFHLIEGSLYEKSNTRRIELLDKALDVILEGTYNRMLHYAHNLKSPITILHMLGVILPILGLVIFPLVGSFLGGVVQWHHLAIMYNIFLPLIVLSLGYKILRKRPTGYGESEILKTNPEFIQYKQWMINDKPAPINARTVGFLVASIMILIGLSPLLVHFVNPTFDIPFFGGNFLDYKSNQGPYGTGALFMSLLIPLGLAMGIGLYYKLTTRRLITIKREVDDLEEEFSGAIFQLGNRIGDGIPTEMAFGEVAQTMTGTPTGTLFGTIDRNIRKLGYGIKRAIFDERVGAILQYPSKLIESTMKALVETSRKGPLIVSSSLMTISKYSQKIKSVNERLRDLLADVLSSMTSQISFLAPLIAGIVVGVGSMVTTIINQLGEQFATLGSTNQEFSNLGAVASILNIKDVIPPYYFQIIVGVYIVQVIIILTILSTSIERGVDTTTTKNRIGKNLFRGITLYTIVSLIGIIIFTFLANAVSIVSATTG